MTNERNSLLPRPSPPPTSPSMRRFVWQMVGIIAFALLIAGAMYASILFLNRGSRKVYEEGKCWSLVGEVVGNDSAEFGDSVSMSSDGEIIAAATSQRGVKILRKTDLGKLEQIGEIELSLTNNNSSIFIGTSVSLSSNGTIIAIGSPLFGRENAETNRGCVRVYKMSENERWEEVGNIIDGEPYSDSGSSVSLSSDGQFLAMLSSNGIFESRVRVYAYNGSLWSQRGKVIGGILTYDQSGTSVSISADGTIVAVGSPRAASGGYARVYQYQNTEWKERGQDITDKLRQNNDLTGSSVSMSPDGSRLAVGSMWGGSGWFFGLGEHRGWAKVYDFSDSKGWHLVGDDLNGLAAHDENGFSVSLSRDGTVTAVVAPSQAKPTSYVQLYKLSKDRSWELLGSEINLDGEDGTESRSVALSADGTVVVVGTPWVGGNGDGNGRIRVYEYGGEC